MGFLYDFFDFPLWASILVPVVLGFASGSTTRLSVDNWYRDLRKGPLNPPRWVFPVVWGILYPSMGYAAFLVQKVAFHSDDDHLSQLAQHALVLYWSQLILNFFFSPIFFVLKRIDFALAEIVILDLVLTFTTINFYEVNHTAGYILIPYLVWTFFATYTTYVTMTLNPVQATGGDSQESRPLLS